MTIDFGPKFRLALEVLNYSRSRCAQELGVHKSIVSRWAAGQTLPTEHNLTRLTELLRQTRPEFSTSTWRLDADDFAQRLGCLQASKLHASFERPAIAVLAFDNLSADPAQDFFSDGVAEDIITELSHNRSLVVIARNSSFTYKGRAVDVRQVARELGVQYVLEGSVIRNDQRMRITARLIDADTLRLIWAERYEVGMIDLFAVQDAVTVAVVLAIGAAVAETEQRRALRKVSTKLNAWEAYQRGLWHLGKATAIDNERAKEFFHRSVALDSVFAPPCAALAFLYTFEGAGWATRPLQDATELSRNWARRAVDIDPQDGDATAIVAYAEMVAGQADEALQRASGAIAAAPNSHWANNVMGCVLLHGSRPADGRTALLSALRLSPLDRSNAGFTQMIPNSYYLEGNYLGAVDASRHAIINYPGFPQPYRWLAAALGQLGRHQEAAIALRQAIEASPSSFEFFTRQRPPWYQAEDHAHMLDGLRQAGWQD